MPKVVKVMSPVQTSPVEQYTSTKTQVEDAPEAVAEDQAEAKRNPPPLMAGDCVFFCKGNSFGSVVWPALIKHVNANDTLDLVVFDAGGIMHLTGVLHDETKPPNTWHHRPERSATC